MEYVVYWEILFSPEDRQRFPQRHGPHRARNPDQQRSDPQSLATENEDNRPVSTGGLQLGDQLQPGRSEPDADRLAELREGRVDHVAIRVMPIVEEPWR